ncbi:MAG: extracellular solute-binding protein [Clostridia bacterium]|nr:extracellular solute-binding protein [Clostridia bacterium]
MKKNFFKKALALALCALTATSTVACGGGGNEGGGIGGEKIDANKTQLNVFHYFAGFGDEWLIELKKNFEEKYANVSFEEGKMGVQVHHRGEMRDFTPTQVKTEQFDVYFMESPSDFLNIMAEGSVEPLDSIMETPNPDDNNQTIVEKMTAQQIGFYKFKDGHYYGIPHYAGNYGLIYNRDLFEEKGFFLAAEEDEDGNILITPENPTKSVGPDGKAGTEDDGLPRTYDEFFALCEEIDARGVDPVCFPGMYTQQHLMLLMDNLVANHEGGEQIAIGYTFSGTAENLVVFNEDGTVKKNADGTPVTESLEITEANAYELARQEGRYYGMQFLVKLLSNKAYYNEADGENDQISHTVNQQNFLENGKLGLRQSAMLADGTWWQIEADDVFNYMAEEDKKWAKENRKFGWLPLPQATEEEAAKIASGEKKSTFCDYLNAVSCIKSGLSDGVKKAALEFLKYTYTDEALANFTYTTGTTVGVEYLDAVDRSRLNYYETSLVNYLEASDIAYHVPGSDRYARNIKSLMPAAMYGSGIFTTLERAVWDAGVTADEYFIGHQAFYKGCAW